MKCPTCGTDADRVIDSRRCEGGRGVRRCRECVATLGGCGQRFTSYERVESDHKPVVEVAVRVMARDFFNRVRGIVEELDP